MINRMKFQGGPAFGKGRKGNVQETPAKTNMDPKNCNFQIRIYILFQGSIYRCQPLAFGGVNSKAWEFGGNDLEPCMNLGLGCIFE